MSAIIASTPEHPGAYIRARVLPTGLTVTKCAELLDVGRPALSNLLNGKASLSTEMAQRFEKAFGTRGEILLQMQAAYDEYQSRARAKEIAVRTYAPSFLAITATQIMAWATKIATRQHLAALLRKLVNTTGTALKRVDFPAFDNAERHGWDGHVVADAVTPWIPLGESGWEFGCNSDASGKANEDYAARVAGLSPAERQNITFVFVTPQNWLGKDKWAAHKRSERQWKEVRAFDASDIEQWLEQSVPTQTWLAGQLNVRSEDIFSLDDCWTQWANVTEPVLSKTLFKGSVELHKNKLQVWLEQVPARPFIVTADSEPEALAFLACALEAIDASDNHFYDQAVAIRSANALQKATAVSAGFIAIIASADAENQSAGIQRKQHTIIVRRKNLGNVTPDVALDLLDEDTFRTALAAMGIGSDEVPRYARESGLSPTILRRRLSQIPALRIPPWSQDVALARKLIPVALVGAWNNQTEGDREILKCLTGGAYETVEETVAELMRSEQPPVWAAGTHRGVYSKIDVLYAISQLVTTHHLTEFFELVELALSERDPALDLATEQRWAANLYGKTREHSSALRESLCESLVLLAVHGNALFERRLGMNITVHVNKLIRKLLLPLDAQTWASQESDLPRYAEAAPEEFLNILEEDLSQPEPKILALLEPAGTGVFGRCPRSGLLWALEVLAWKPERLLPVSKILARLSERKIQDNWQNTPEYSLRSIYRAWMPQTAATVAQRNTVVKFLSQYYPDVGWNLCIKQLYSGSDIGNYSYRPRWRNDASGHGQPVTINERNDVCRHAIEIVLDWPNHNEKTLADLIERVNLMSAPHQQRVWERVAEWASASSDDNARATLQETIRQYAFTRRGTMRELTESTVRSAREAYDALAPNDNVLRHRWLFTQRWVDLSSDEVNDDKLDLEKRELLVSEMRATALQEVYDDTGYDGLIRLCNIGDASYTVGSLLANGIIRNQELVEVLARLLSEPRGGTWIRINNCIEGILARLDDATRAGTIRRIISKYPDVDEQSREKLARLMVCAPFRQTTWDHFDQLSPDLKTRYWKNVYPQWLDQSAEELNQIVDGLLEVDRPRAALSLVHLAWKSIESPRIVRLLQSAATSNSEQEGQFHISSYEISGALKELGNRPEVSSDEIASLEFTYISALEFDDYGIPNLERQLSESPALFVKAIALTYKRRDEGEDPPDWRLNESNKTIATQTYRLLTKAQRIPGTTEDGSINPSTLIEWMRTVRQLCQTYGRGSAGDHSIGELLSKCPQGIDGIWPCEPVRQALEEFRSNDIADGLAIGVFNARGATLRGEGGDQERELATTYRTYSNALAFEYPFVSRCLEQIALQYDRDATFYDTDSVVKKRFGQCSAAREHIS